MTYMSCKQYCSAIVRRLLTQHERLQHGGRRTNERRFHKVSLFRRLQQSGPRLCWLSLLGYQARNRNGIKPGALRLHVSSAHNVPFTPQLLTEAP